MSSMSALERLTQERDPGLFEQRDHGGVVDVLVHVDVRPAHVHRRYEVRSSPRGPPFHSCVSCCGSDGPPPTTSRGRRSPHFVDLVQACAAPAARGSRWSAPTPRSSPHRSRRARRRPARRNTASAAIRRCRRESPTAPTNASGRRAAARDTAVSSPSVPRIVHQREVGVGHLGRVAVDDVGDVDDVEQAVLVQTGRDDVGQVFGHTVRGELARPPCRRWRGRRRAATPSCAASARPPSRRTG